MSPLWTDSNKKKLLTMHKRPSPTCNNHIHCFAQSIISHLEHNTFVSSGIFRFIKGISLLTSLEKKIGASMTVEASIVLPLFLFFFLNLGCAIEMIRLHGNLELALWETGNSLAVYGHVINEDAAVQEPDLKKATTGDVSDSFWAELAGVVFSYTYVKSQIVEYLGEEYLENSPLTYGVDGLQFVESNIWENDGKFELVVTYSVSPLSDISGFRSFRMVNRYYGHFWNGYQISTENEDPEKYVYITENGEVYHILKSCTHLKISVRQVSLQEAYISRNKYGNKYEVCGKCGENGYEGWVYITNEGECFHYVRNCSGLKRTIYCVPLSEVSERRPCTRCAQ